MRILVLSTWYPYPLSQGSKIRAYHLIKGLAQRHDVSLLSFQDGPLQPAWLDHMREYCRRVDIVQQNPFAYRRVGALSGWSSPRPSAVVASHSPEMVRQVSWVAGEWRPERVLALTFVTAPYALAVRGVSKAVDVDNLMAPMLRESARKSKKVLQRLRNWLAYEKFQRYEQWLYPQFDRCLVVSERDRLALKEQSCLQDDRIGVVPNGVDTAAYTAASAVPQPNTMIFNGALTYAANFDAMAYFLSEIFPEIRARVPEARLKITGSTQGVPLDRLPADDHVFFTGYLDDIRPEVAGSWLCAVPLRMGGGTRLKILEAMALGTPVVSTSKGAEGLEVEAGKHLLIADSPAAFAEAAARLLREPGLRQSLVAHATELIKDRYDWVKIGRHLCDLVENV